MTTTNNKAAVLVLGAPRSGTSAVSHALSMLGVNFGHQSRFVDVSVATHNPIFFELKSLNRLNDEIFEGFGRAYADFDFMPLTEDFTADRVDAFVPKCRALLEREFGGSSLVGLKDPRFCFTLPLWAAALPQLGYAIRCVWVLRPLGEVVASNARVNVDWPWARNVRIAALSTLAAAYATDGLDCLRVEYAKALSAPEVWVAHLAKWLHDGAAQKQLDAATAVFEPQLRHVSSAGRAVPPAIATLYDTARVGQLDAARYRELAQVLRGFGIERVGDADARAAGMPSVARSDKGCALLYLGDAQGRYDAARAVRVEHENLAGGSWLEFKLPAGKRPALVRFDPDEKAGIFEVRGLRVDGTEVADMTGRIRRSNQSVVRAQAGGSVWVVSADDDPWLEFDVEGLYAARDESSCVSVESYRRRAEDALAPVMAAMIEWSRQADVARLEAMAAEGTAREAALHELVAAGQAEATRLAAEVAAGRAREAALQEQVASQQAEAARLAAEVAAGGAREAALQEQAASRQATAERVATDLAASRERERAAQRDASAMAERASESRLALRATEARVVMLSADHTELANERSRLGAAAAATATELAAIKASTLWQALMLLRGILLRLPVPARMLLRRGLKAIWWTVTPWRIPARLRIWRQRVQQAPLAPVAPAALADAAPQAPTAAPTPRYVYAAPAMDAVQVGDMLSRRSRRTLFSVVVPVYNTDPQLLRRAIASVRSQWYPDWELILVDDHSPAPHVRQTLAGLTDRRIVVIHLDENRRISGATNAGIARAKGDFIVFLDHDDELTPDCLYELALCIDRENPDYVYSDEDKLDVDGSFRDPFFKPDWSPDTLMSTMYTCHVSCVRRTLANEVGGLRSEYDGSQDWDFVLRVTERTQRIAHIPKVLYHWRINPASCASDLQAKPYAIDASKRAREDALRRRGLSGELVPVPELPGYFRTRYHLRGEPLFSIVIPSKNNGKVLKACIDSIFGKTRYRRFEVVVVNNGSTDGATLEYLAALRSVDGVKVLDHDVPFNYSEINNFGVTYTSGDILVFLNDDTEVISEDWLDYMGGYAQLTHVGAVGAKLLYPGGMTIQHAGVVNLACGPSHAFVHMAASAPGYFNRNLLEYNWLAVTGACMMLARTKFEAVSGFDNDLAVAYNDIELCLSLYKRGWFQVVCPSVKLIHHESLSRGNDLLDPAKKARLDSERGVMYRKHGDMVHRAPFYNPNLDPYDPHFGLRVGSRAFAACNSSRLVLPDRPPALGRCSLDLVNSHPVADKVVLKRDAEVTFAGWAGNGNGQAAGTFELVLKGPSGTYCASVCTGIARADVARALNSPGLAVSGYRLTVSVETVPPGIYALYVVNRAFPDAGCKLPCEFAVV